MVATVASTVAGRMLKRVVAVGDLISADTEVAIIEAMKMHIPVLAEQAGRVTEWLVDEDGAVKEGQPLLALDGDMTHRS